MSSTPTRPIEPSYEAPRGNHAIIGKSVILRGQISSREDLTIDGEVEGTLELHDHRLTVGANGKVKANIKAREVVVIGTITGNVETTDRLEIRKEAKLIGDIKTARVQIEDGAYFKGHVDIARADAPRAAAASAGSAQKTPQPSPTPSSPNQSAPVAAGAGDAKR